MTVYYKGEPCYQVKNFQPIMEYFLHSEQFTDIIELGTAWGGFTMFLKDTLPNANVISYDVNVDVSYLKQMGIDFRHWNPLSNDYQFVKSDFIEAVSLSKKLLILIDGADKPKEFAMIAPLLRVGDHIMCHDYIVDSETFEKDYKDKTWDSHEICDADMRDVCAKFNLETVHPYLNAIVWQCKRKMK